MQVHMGLRLHHFGESIDSIRLKSIRLQVNRQKDLKTKFLTDGITDSF